MINTVSAKDIFEWVVGAFLFGCVAGFALACWLAHKYGWK